MHVLVIGTTSGILDLVVSPAADLLLAGIAELDHRRLVGSKTIGSDSFQRAMALDHLLQEPECCSFVSIPRHKALEDLAFVINRTPKVAQLAVDFTCISTATRIISGELSK